MKKLIVNADDFGLCEGVNKGIVSAHLNGIVTSTTIMANMPYVDHGISLLKEVPTLGTGVHLTLSCGRPFLKSHKTIIDENGAFYKRVDDELVKNTFDLEEVYNEYCAQVEYLLDRGVQLTHIDSHHHLHTLHSLKSVISKIVDKYKLPIRGVYNFEMKSTTLIKCYPNFYQECATIQTLANCIDSIEEDGYLDMMCHPSFEDEVLNSTSSYNKYRVLEHALLTSKEVTELVANKGLVLSSYKGIVD